MTAPEDPHSNAPDEDPEQCIGEVIADPWDDDAQTDWRTVSLPTPPVEVD